MLELTFAIYHSSRSLSSQASVGILVLTGMWKHT